MLAQPCAHAWGVCLMAQLTPAAAAVGMSNGVHHQNGGLEDGAAASSAVRGAPEFLGPRQLINRHEYIRLLQQSLHRLGFSEAAHRLERDSVRAFAHVPC